MNSRTMISDYDDYGLTLKTMTMKAIRNLNRMNSIKFTGDVSLFHSSIDTKPK